MADTDSRMDTLYSQQMPPGTVYLGEGHSDAGFDRDNNGHVNLHPRPTTDPNEPLNWPMHEKVANFAIACLFTLMVFATLDVCTVTWDAMGADLGFGYGYLNNSYAAGLAGMTIGSIFFIPAAMIFGRKPVYLFAALTMVLVIAGLAGSINDTIIQMTISDLFFVHQRATLNGVYSSVVVIGTYLSLIPAGYIVRSQGWRWVWWWCAILNAIVLLLLIFAYGETQYHRAENAPLVGEEPPMPGTLDKDPDKQPVPEKTNSTEPATVQPREHVDAEQPTPPTRKTSIQRMAVFGTTSEFSAKEYWRHMWRPFLLFFRVPAVAFAAIEYSFILCWVAILATTQPMLFAQPPYNFSSIGIGNINIAPFIGAVVGSVYGGPLNDYYVVFMARRRSGIHHPETRLHMLFLSLLLTPAGLWLYGISIAKVKSHPSGINSGTEAHNLQSQPWIAPLIGSGVVGFGIGSVTAITLSYFADSYREIVAEGLIVITYVRNGIAMAAAFAVNPWLNGLGPQNMFICAGCLCLGIQLLTIPMVIWGRKARYHTAPFYNSIIAQG